MKGLALTGSGVTRRPGTHVVWVQTQGSIELKSSGGAVTGFEGTTTGRYLLATGAAASLQGKTYTNKFTSIAPGRFRVETTVD